MQLFIILAVLLTFERASSASLTVAENNLCQVYIQQFKKSYSEAEYTRRFENQICYLITQITKMLILKLIPTDVK